MKFIILISALFLIQSSTILVDKGVYLSTYSESLQNPIKVEYSVYKYAKSDSVKRKGMYFKGEQGIKTATNLAFYTNIWDKGHLAPAESFNRTYQDMKKTFSYVNCTPQHENLNRGMWRRLENRVRKLSQTDSIIVIVDIHFGGQPERLKDNTAIPLGFTKTIIKYYAKDTVQYYFDNVICKGDLNDYKLVR